MDDLLVEFTFLHVESMEIMILLAFCDVLEDSGAMLRNHENP